MSIAVYWDFENIHASLGSLKFGATWYKDNRYSIQDKIVDIGSIADMISSLGKIDIHKAYGDWTNFGKYSGDFLDYSIDLIQLFPRGMHSKNGADIRLVIDVLDDINTYGQIDQVVLISGDSDFISLAQKLKQKGKKILGIGVRETTNKYWIKACNEFKYYSTICPENSLVAELERSDIGSGKALLIEALEKLQNLKGKDEFVLPQIKDMLKSIDPAFDERNYGISSFSKFIMEYDDIVEYVKNDSGSMGRIKAGLATPAEENASCAEEEKEDDEYVKILKRQQYKMMDRTKFTQIVREIVAQFAANGSFENFELLKGRVMLELHRENPSITDSEYSRAKQILYKNFIFRFNNDNNKIALYKEDATYEDVIDLLNRNVTKRIMDNLQSRPDEGKLAEILYVNNCSRQIAMDYINRYINNNA